MSQPVFLSSVTSNFPGFRQLIAEDLRKADAEVRDQEHFRNRGGLLLKLLDDYIRECRVVIHLVGAKAGYIAKPDEVAYLLDQYTDFVTRFPTVAPFVHELSYTSGKPGSRCTTGAICSCGSISRKPFRKVAWALAHVDRRTAISRGLKSTLRGHASQVSKPTSI